VANRDEVSDRIGSSASVLRWAGALLVALVLTSAGSATGQVRDLLEQLLGGGDEGGRIESVESDSTGRDSVSLIVTYADVDAPEEVTVTARVLDTGLKSLGGFSLDQVSLTAAEGAVETTLRYVGGDEVKSVSVEVRLERSGEVVARKLHALLKIWGEESDRQPSAHSAGGAGAESLTADEPQREPQEIVVDPVPLGDTPTGSTTGGGSTGGGNTPGGDIVLLPPDSPPVNQGPSRLIPVYSWWSGSNQDHLCTSDPNWAGTAGATKSAYRFYRREGYIYAPDGAQPTGTLPLYRWWNASRKDHFTTTNPVWKGVPGQTRDGYTFVRLEGYVAKDAGSGRVALKSYWSPSRTDNVATSDAAWNQAQRRSPDYRASTQVSGYLLSSAGGLTLRPDLTKAILGAKVASPGLFKLATPPRLIPVYSWWSGSNQDHLCTSDPNWAGTAGATKSAYRFYRREGYIYAPDGAQPTGTLPLYRWWNASRKDHFTTTNPVWKGVPGQTKSGYTFVRLEGYVAKDPGNGRLALKSYWSPSRTDNVATSDAAWNQAQRRSPDYRASTQVSGYLFSSSSGR